MPYGDIEQTQNSNNIAERQWARGNQARYSTFTSCIGVQAKVQGSNEVVGIHLVLFSEGGVFDPVAATQVEDILRQNNCDTSTVTISGITSCWLGTPGFTSLTGKFPGCTILGDQDTGIYGATVQGNGVNAYKF